MLPHLTEEMSSPTLQNAGKRAGSREPRMSANTALCGAPDSAEGAQVRRVEDVRREEQVEDGDRGPKLWARLGGFQELQEDRGKSYRQPRLSKR